MSEQTSMNVEERLTRLEKWVYRLFIVMILGCIVFTVLILMKR